MATNRLGLAKIMVYSGKKEIDIGQTTRIHRYRDQHIPLAHIRY